MTTQTSDDARVMATPLYTRSNTTIADGASEQIELPWARRYTAAAGANLQAFKRSRHESPRRRLVCAFPRWGGERSDAYGQSIMRRVGVVDAATRDHHAGSSRRFRRLHSAWSS